LRPKRPKLPNGLRPQLLRSVIVLRPKLPNGLRPQLLRSVIVLRPKLPNGLRPPNGLLPNGLRPPNGLLPKLQKQLGWRVFVRSPSLNPEPQKPTSLNPKFSTLNPDDG
jgi:hypothetical protein